MSACVILIALALIMTECIIIIIDSQLNICNNTKYNKKKPKQKRYWSFFNSRVLIQSTLNLFIKHVWQQLAKVLYSQK